MNTVLGVDLEALAAAIFRFNHFVHTGRAVALGRFVVLGQVFLQRNVRVGQLQVNRLVFLVVGVGDKHRRQAIKGQLVVRLRIGDHLALSRRLHGGVVRGGVVEGKRQAAAQNVLLHKRDCTTNHAAKLVNGRAKVALGVQFFVQPAVFETLLEAGDLLARLAILQGFEYCFSAQHAGLHGGVGALDLGEVQGAGVTAQQQAAREAHFRQGVITTFGNCTGTVGYAFAAFQVLLDLRVVLQALHLFKRAEVRVAVVEVGNQAHVHLAIFQVIQERTAGRAGFAQRPAGRVNHQARLVFGRIDVPQLLDTDAVMLRILAFVQLVILDQLLAEVTAAAFGEQGVLGAQFHTRHVAIFLGTVTGHAHIAGDDAFNLAVFNDGFSRGKARINLYTQLLGLLGQPAAQVTKADNIVAVVVHVLGHKGIGNFDGFFLALHQENIVPGNRRIQRSAFLFPVREEFVQGRGLEYRTCEDVRPDFGTFFYYTNSQFFASFLRQLHDAAGSRQASRAAADDQNIKFHRFAFHVGLLKQLLMNVINPKDSVFQ